MTMPVMDIRKMRMSVRHRCVFVGMCMRFLAVPRKFVRMLVMGIVIVRMGVQHVFVRMLVAVRLGQM